MMPRLRIPLWAAVALPAAAYAIRGLLRGTLRPDLPQDAVVVASLAIVLVLASRHRSAAEDRDHSLTRDMQENDHPEGAER